MSEFSSKISNFARSIFNFQSLRKVLSLLELVALPLGVFALYQGSIALQQGATALRLQADANEQQVIASAWQQLTTPASGNTGKADAMMTLAGKGVELTNLRLDCEAMGSSYEADDVFNETKRCIGPPSILGLTLKYPNVEELTGINLDGTLISRVYFEGILLLNLSLRYSYIRDFEAIDSNIYDLDFSGSLLEHSVFDGRSPGDEHTGRSVDGFVAQSARLQHVSFILTYMSGADFTGSKFSSVKFQIERIENWNVSGVDFCWKPIFMDYSNEFTPESFCAQGLDIEHFQNMWAWEDDPPKGVGIVGALLSEVKLCPASLREQYYESITQKTIDWVVNRGYTLPEGC